MIYELYILYIISSNLYGIPWTMWHALSSLCESVLSPVSFESGLFPTPSNRLSKSISLFPSSHGKGPAQFFSAHGMNFGFSKLTYWEKRTDFIGYESKQQYHFGSTFISNKSSFFLVPRRFVQVFIFFGVMFMSPGTCRRIYHTSKKSWVALRPRKK